MDVFLINRPYGNIRRIVALASALLVCQVSGAALQAQSAHWIWTSGQEAGLVPIGPTHYRKNFTLTRPVEAELVIAADDEFQVYFNGELVGYGAGYDSLTKIELTPWLRDGDNLLAIRATNTEGTTAALSAIMRFKLQGETAWRWLATDETWKSATDVAPTWINRRYDDSGWVPVSRLGVLGTTSPWDTARLAASSQAVAKPGRSAERSGPPEPKSFKVPANFEVQQILDNSVGSLIAMEFNEFGQLLLSREGGKLLLADLTDSEQGEIAVRQYCDAIDNVQGILPLNGDVYVTGDGPDGLALYRLSDADRDGNLEPSATLAKFKGPPGEHGPHGITLGPDGMIYVMVGNTSGLLSDFDATSPVRHIHEGEVLPRLDDPGGHATGIRAPGGTVVRISPDGQRRELVAVGLRNAYDLAFNRNGELFFQDSDMESDVGTPWYRPTQVYHLVEGGEYGWRSGTAKFPAYFVDNLPAIADTGRGSPTGAVVYDHFMLPIRYHGQLFVGDWSEGRILAVRLQPDGDSFRARFEEFLSARPLTVTDLAVGPDGALYFCTGGRGTEGGVYRVSWKGDVPESFLNLDDPLMKLVGRPQPQSAWTRQELAKIKTEIGDQAWTETLRGIMLESRNEAEYRLRALETLSLYGPAPGDDDLIRLSSDINPAIRARVARELGWRLADTAAPVLIKMLGDEDARVRRASCHSLVRLDIKPEFSQVAPILESANRTESFAARRLLETMDVESWKTTVLESGQRRLFVNGATALMIVEPSLANAYAILARVSQWLDQSASDSDMLDLLRVTELALAEGSVDPAKIPLFHQRILDQFPAADGRINRELSRILGYLQESAIGEKIPHYLANSIDSDMDKMQVLMNVRGLTADFSGEQRMAAIAFLEEMQTSARTVRTGNYSLYVSEILKSWSSQIEPGQISEILRNGARWPSAALAAFYLLPEHLDEQQVQWIIEMDRQLKGRTEATAQQARLGCLAVLGRSGDEPAMSYLREVWRHDTSRRDHVTLALAQRPDGPNWPYLISSLGQVTDDTSAEVLQQLATVDKRPSEPVFLKQTILTGYRLRDQGAQPASQLLQHWTGNKVDGDEHNWRVIMESWASWFNEQYPDEEPIVFDDQASTGKYSVDQILSFIEDNPAAARHNGMLMFSRAQCSSCHRCNGHGESLGPELSTLARRFSRRETLRAVLHPSEVISDQFAGKKVLTTDGRQLLGLLRCSGDDYIMLQTNGQKTTLSGNEIEEILPAETSPMPEGLLDELSLEEIRDLMAWLYEQPEQVAEHPANPSR